MSASNARRRYASGTAVPISRSQDEVIRLVDRLGATAVVNGRSGIVSGLGVVVLLLGVLAC